MSRKNEQGFTLIELLLVVVIIGILLAVIVPRAWRANVDAKYGLVRQNCAELASFASQWAEQMMEAQNLNSGSRLVAYYNSLTDPGTANADNSARTTGSAVWIARNAGASSWNNTVQNYAIVDRIIGTTNPARPEAAVEDLVPPERLQRNPFSGASVFRDLPTTSIVIPGAIAAGGVVETTGWNYYALVFQGTDSTASATPSAGALHAGMGVDLPGLRNGIFMARLQHE